MRTHSEFVRSDITSPIHRGYRSCELRGKFFLKFPKLILSFGLGGIFGNRNHIILNDVSIPQKQRQKSAIEFAKITA